MSRTTASSRAADTARPCELPTLGRWQLVERLGGGPLTSVYRARPIDCPCDWPADYAIKLVEPDQFGERGPLVEQGQTVEQGQLVERGPSGDAIAASLLQREAFVARQVTHPHLAPVLAAHVDAPPFYFVMPLLEGETLADRIAAGPLDVAESLWIARQTAEALAALHAAGWRHGDVKPANVFASSTGHVTLIDLGFARRLDEPPLGGEPLLGTPAYVAPECLCLVQPLGQQADVYSLGVTLFEMLAGQRPYAAQHPADLAAAHLYGPTPEVRKLAPAAPRELSHLLRRMLAKDPLRRPDSYELVEQLTRLEIECFSLHPWAA